MAKEFIEEYKELQKTRRLINSDILISKKGKIWEHFRNLNTVNISNLEKNVAAKTNFYQAPLFKIHNSYMLNCGSSDRDEIYVDEEFLSKDENLGIIDHQLTHEVLHSLCKINGARVKFGHNINPDNDYLRGINEAVTQVFADDIEKSELGPEEDYLYFIKNVMRVMKNTIGPSYLANQYLNNNISFEEKFNEITNGKFDDFVFIINNIYKLDKEKHYGMITKQENEVLTSTQDLILNFTSVFVKKAATQDPEVYQRIKNDFFNTDFLSKLQIEQLNDNIKN